MRTTGITVAEVMTRDVITVGPDMPLKEAATVIAERGVSGVPVCEEDGTVVGVLSESDLLVKQSGARPRGGLFSLLAESREPADLVKAHAHTAGRAMTAPAITIAPDATVTEAARLMSERNLNRLPVVDAGRLVGIVTRADLVRAFVRSDAEIEEEIRRDVLERTLWAEAGQVELEVRRGTVTLRGALPRRSEVELLERLVRRVPGVITVASSVAWGVDDLTRREPALRA